MQKNKIIIGISGGVDSAVSLALLKEKNYAVSAVFLRFLDGAEKYKKALVDAKNICMILDVPLIVVDVRKEFEKIVVKYFIEEYARGNTPNPCVFCNERMKFKFLFEVADKSEIDLVATGHYAQVMPSFLKGKKQEKSKIKKKVFYDLFPAKDVDKDQSYFLYRLGQKELMRIVFPLGEYQKADVRKLAEKFKLPIFDKNDSQDICFMADNNLEKFLAKKIKLKKGNIVNTEGKLLGEHKGLALYTIGQRRGIKIGGTGPYFVVTKDVKKNNLVVTNCPNHPALMKKTIELVDVVWTSGKAPKLPLTLTVRTRYHNPLVSAIIRSSKKEKSCQVEFKIPQKRVSSGQSVVFYGKKGEVLGGGIIKK